MAGKTKLHSSQYIGITEAGEVAFDLSVFDRLCLGNIIITKRLTDTLIEKLVEHKDRIILHITCTGMGGSRVEPFVPTFEQTYEKTVKLIDSGFPISHIVLRVDPIVPTARGEITAIKVLDKFLPLGIKRVRYSLLDMYAHVKERFNEAGFPIPFDGFHAPLDVRKKVAMTVIGMCRKYGDDIVAEACGEPGIPSQSCLSQCDLDILGLTDTIVLQGKADQRGSCSCPANKKELLKNNSGKPCANDCKYCFWKADKELKNHN